MKRTTPTPAAVRAAPSAQSLRLSRRWRVHWQHHEPTIARYQAPVSLARVLSEHHAAVAAEPMER
ncbi:hypothetical protein [Thauera chlorobenzoica]|uniref:hypothetical protein n=1 Tax=Thauera chlorobenzoica TaxID=96773 RepID=UPI0008A04782|nr:hypothetical protein [Thauera chlorobenzoica]SEF71643.1 hypothetical protein SAMN05216242_104125 [Thauera chlorobenzoica]